MKTLYLHIGTPKTATTSIQRFCDSNQQALEAHGYTYPDFPFHYEHKGRSRNALFLTTQILDQNGKRLRAQEEKNLQEGYALIDDAFQKFDSVILSDEMIWHLTHPGRERAHLWEELKGKSREGGYSVKIIVYLRRQDCYCSSYWNQIIKKGVDPWQTRTWEEWLQNKGFLRFLQYYEKLEGIAEVFGRENIVVRRFERGKFYRGMVEADFLQAIGIEMTDEFRIPEYEANPGLAGNLVEFKRLINTLPDLSFQDKKFFWKTLSACSDLSEANYPSGMFSQEEAAAFMEQYEEGNCKIVKEYLHEDDAPLFDMTFRDVPKWQKDNPRYLDDMLVFFAESQITLRHETDKLKGKNKELMEETERLQRKINSLKKERQPLLSRKTAKAVLRRLNVTGK